jgi:hypothetical protein
MISPSDRRGLIPSFDSGIARASLWDDGCVDETDASLVSANLEVPTAKRGGRSMCHI